MSRFDVNVTMYIVRKVVFRSEDTMAEGDYVFVLATKDRAEADRVYEELRGAGEWVEMTERTVTERRIYQSHDEMPEEW